MNERILEIGKETGVITGQTTLAEVEKLHQFAQSIVKECKSIVSNRANGLTTDHWCIHNNAVWCIYGDLRDQLGE
jgi:hypothetical protein